MNSLQTTTLIFALIAIILSVITLLYAIASQRRKSIVLKKVDYLVEDLTYKSEMLNPSVETLSKVSNYVDIFEIAARKNIKVAAKVAARNKDDIYKIANRFKKAMMPKEKHQETTETTEEGGGENV